jgi:hypothetical protein
MHDISHTTFDTYREVAPDDYSIAMLFLLLLLSSEIGGFRILHVHPISTVRKPWESTTVCVKE